MGDKTGEWPKPWYKILYAPWRIKYITSGERFEGCVFCNVTSQKDEEALIVYRGKLSYVILNRYPYNSGHIMIVPYRHVPSLDELNLAELAEMMLLLKASIRALKEAYRPHGINIGVNIGEAAGAGIAGHVHIHVLPRWTGDTNFTVMFSGTKVVPEALEDTYRKLKSILPDKVMEVIREEGLEWDTSS
ncbi:MAG: HIT domain-containing protein [Desulfurococcales archaeon]|nr:HIT domain-containing protein [Desulfurococcales archaeon]MCE4622566.1 HIT domain-containing protein [Desulfurococcales archaeon]